MPTSTTRAIWSARVVGASFGSMSTFQLQERFSLDAAPERVWSHLTDPLRTVECLPGAEITGQEDQRTYRGTVKVKVGSVTVSYGGSVVFEEIDEAERYVRVVGKGREKSGSGSAEMTMESRVLPLDGGGTEVTVEARVRLTGKIVRFGRGMIEAVSAEILSEFRARLADRLRQASATDDRDATGPAAEEAGRDGRGGEDDRIRLIPLLLRALRSWLARLFKRG